MADEVNNEALAKPPPRFSAGEPVSASKMNKMRESIVACANRAVNPPRQLAFRAIPQIIFQMIIIGEYEDGDALVCNTWDGENQGDEEIAVAKPYLLQQSTLDGYDDGTYTYAFTDIDELTVTKTEDESTEDWKVTMDYNDGDIIYAAANVIGGIDCPTEVQYIDLNIDGRAWAKV